MARDATRCSGRAGRPEERGSGRRSPGPETRPTGLPTVPPRPRRECLIARTPSVHEGRSAPPPPRGGRRGGGQRAPSSSPPHPRREPARPGGPGSRAGDPRPGHTGDGRRALGVRPFPRPTGAGDAGRRGHGDRPAGGRPGTQPAFGRAHRSGGAAGVWWGGGGHGRSPLSSTRRRRWTGGGETGNGSRPRLAREARHTRARPRGAADGERTEADGQTERGTDGVRPREAKATQPAVEVGWPRATARGMAQNDPVEGSRPPGRTAGSHRQRPPSTGAVPRHTRDDGLAPPSRGSRPPPLTHPEPQPARENALPPRTGVPHGPHTRNPAVPGSPPRSLSQGSEGTALPGDATGGRRPRDDTHVRRGRLGPRQGNASGLTRGTRRKAGSGGEGPTSTHSGGRPGTRKHRDTAWPPGKPARDPNATHTRGRFCDAWDAGWSRPSPERAPRPGPAATAGVPSTHLSSVHPRQIRLST